MSKKFFIALALLIAGCSDADAQQPGRFLVKFKNKDTNPFSLSSPSAYLSARSIERRTKYAIPYDSTDLPVTPRYLDSIRSIPTVLVLNASKWLNQVSIKITDTSAANIAAVQNRLNNMPFVKSYAAISMRAGVDKNALPADPANTRTMRTLADYYNYGTSSNQVKIHNGEFLHNIGLRGTNMIIGMLDGGYKNYLTVKAIDSARSNGQILGTWDFVANETSVNEDHQHGMECLSIIVGNVPGQLVGTAPKASFVLYRTEDVATETPIEEHNWVCGAERVDSVGGDIISSSLGYNTFDAPFTSHTYSEFNGNTTMPAIGADLAAKKGILVVNAAGNEGSNSWGKIITPADADSILAVGAVSSTGIPASFTSRGPSSDGQVKPDVVSMGVSTILQYPDNTIGPGNGTSFAAPNLAGLTTCLWQGFPEFNNMKIINAIRQSGNRFTNPNDTVGYGIPDMKKAFLSLLHDFSTATATVNNCKTSISLTSKDISTMKYEIERSTGGGPFVKVSEQQALSSSFDIRSYNLSDTLINVASGLVTYRIRQIIDTSVAGFRAGYIDTFTVNLSTGCLTGLPVINPGVKEFLLLPNPASNRLSIKLNTTNAIKDLRIRIIDEAGRLTGTIRRSKPAGTINIPIPVINLSKGKYYISIYDGNELLATKELIRL